MCATFKVTVNGVERTLPPLWRVQITGLDGDQVRFAGLQRTTKGGPLQYQEWACRIASNQKGW